MRSMILHHETKFPEKIAEFKDKALHPVVTLLFSYCAITDECDIKSNKFVELKKFREILNSESDDPFFNVDTFKHLFMRYIKKFNLPLEKIKTVYAKYDPYNKIGYILIKFNESINYNGQTVDEVIIEDVFV